MTAYLMRRLLLILPTMAFILLAVVVLVRVMPGSVIDAALEDRSQLTQIDRPALEAKLGLNKPLLVQYLEYTGGVLRGDLGRSLWSNRPVTEMIRGRIGVTIELTGIALLMAIAISTPVGLIGALAKNSPLDYGLRALTVAGLTLPEFVTATMVLVLPAMWFGWTPMLYRAPSVSLSMHLSSLLLPAAILALRLATSQARMMRTMMIEVLGQDYIRTAWAKGLGTHHVLLRHALRNALIPVVTLIGMEIVFLISGAVIIERIFGIPGIGDLLLRAVAQRDYTVIQGLTVLIGAFVLILNLIVDLSYGWLDPRVRVR
jgi:peptide/nickel transport system permease protein